MASAAVAVDFDPATQPQEAVDCALCGPGPTTVVATRDRYGFAVRVVRCTTCGLQFLNPRMTADAYAAFYRDTYRPLLVQYRHKAAVIYDTRGARIRFARPFNLQEMEREQRGYGLRLAHEAAPWMGTSGRVVDLGGSTGAVGRVFRARFGYDVTVIDPSPDELACAVGCEQICAAAEDVEIPPCDVVLLVRTVDHLRAPLTVLTRAREAARVLIVDIMAVDQWPANQRYKVDHPYAFTRTTFLRLLKAAGWTLVSETPRQQGANLSFICT